MKDTWEDLAATVARQDEEFERVRRALEALGDTQLQVPQAFLEELEELTSPRAASPTPFVHGLRA